MNLYINYRFIQRLSIPALYRNIGSGIVVLLLFCQMLYLLAFQFDRFPSFIFLLLGTAIGVSFMLFVVALGYDVLVTAYNLFLRPNGGKIRIIIDVIVIAIMLTYILVGLVGGNRDPEWVNVKVPINVPNHSRFHIVQLSDVHVGHVIKKPFVERLVNRINESSPDLVVITGDLIDRDPDKIEKHLAPLANLKSKYGTFFALGNHEYFHNPERGIEIVKSLGITVLDDKSQTLVDQSGQPFLNVVGLLDLVGRSMDVMVPNDDLAFQKVNKNLPTIVLAHQPLWIQEIAKFQPDLVLTGHTHGGQIFPFSYLVYIQQPYLNGLHQYSNHHYIYISRGTGFWGPPIRVLAPSEITELILTTE